MYAIRVTGPSGYSRYWNEDGAGFLSDRASFVYDTWSDADDAIQRMPFAVCSGRVVDVVNVEGD